MVNMKVKLIQHTPDPEQVVALAARLCYSANGLEQLMQHTSEGNQSLVSKVLGMGHTSIAEHVIFTFGIEGISRVTSHQLVRHRMASYSQQSQRYVQADAEPDVVCPKSVDSYDKLQTFGKAVQAAWDAYNALVGMGVPAEDARYLLPNAATTKMIISMNARELLHFFRLRCCDRAQWEIRAVANAMLQECTRIAPTLFRKAGPPCHSGACPEGSKSCGKEGVHT